MTLGSLLVASHISPGPPKDPVHTSIPSLDKAVPGWSGSLGYQVEKASIRPDEWGQELLDEHRPMRARLS